MKYITCELTIIRGKKVISGVFPNKKEKKVISGVWEQLGVLAI